MLRITTLPTGLGSTSTCTTITRAATYLVKLHTIQVDADVEDQYIIIQRDAQLQSHRTSQKKQVTCCTGQHTHAAYTPLNCLRNRATHRCYKELPFVEDTMATVPAKRLWRRFSSAWKLSMSSEHQHMFTGPVCWGSFEGKLPT
jgi:hypothetical protein